MQMNTELIILASTFVGFLATVVGSFIIVWREIKGVHRIINSRMDELLELTRKSSRAEGVIAGRKQDSPDYE